MSILIFSWISLDPERPDLRAMEAFADLPLLRLASASVGLALAMAIERLWPYRSGLCCDRIGFTGARRELRHLALWGIGAGVVQLLPFLAALGAATAAKGAGIGLLNLVSLPDGLEVLLTVLALDAWTYGMHRLYHAIPALWRFHRVHHSDTSLSATTGVRFHPGEVLISALARLPVLFLLGASPLGVIVFEIALLGMSQLEHANLCLPERWSRRAELLLVTPNLHRSHHSTQWRDADTNFGTISSLWDRLFATLRPVPPEAIVVGAPDALAEPEPTSLVRLLAMPFQSGVRARSTPRVAPSGNR